MEREIHEIELPGGEIVLARVGVPAGADDAPGHGNGSDFEDIGALDALTHRVDQLNEVIGGVGAAVVEAARGARPDEVSATFGIELMVQPGRAVALLADGQAKAAVSVTLTWRPGTSTETEGPAGATDNDRLPGGSPVRRAHG